MKPCAVIFAIVAVLEPIGADIVPARGSQRIRPVFEKSDLVCNCFVESLTHRGERQIKGTSLRRRTVRATARIQDTYKTPDPGLRSIIVEFEHYWPGSMTAEPVLHEAQAGLLFLKRTPSGVYEFADRFLGVTTLRSLSRQPGALGLEKLESALIGVLLQADREERIRALQLLHGFDTLMQSSMFSLAPVSNSQDAELAFWAMAVLLRAKSPGALERLNSYLKSYDGDEGPIWLTGIETDLSQIRDARSLSILYGLSDSKYRPIRLGAVDALRGIKSPQSAPALVRRLDDNDPTIQYIAVISLAEILGKYEGDYAPTMPLFDENPRKYTDLWKKWWAEEGQARNK